MFDSIGKRCVTLLFQSHAHCQWKVSHLFEPRLVALFHQLQFISGCQAIDCSAGQKAGSDGKICKAASHLKDSSHAHLVQERAGWHTPHICSSSHGTFVPDIQHYSCQFHLLLEWWAGCRHNTLEHTSCNSPEGNTLLQLLPEQKLSRQFAVYTLHR